MNENKRFLNVLVDSGFKHPLTYVELGSKIIPGDLVWVSYRHKQKLGVVIEEVAPPQNIAINKFKVIDAESAIPLSKDLYETLRILRSYYLADAGEIMRTMRLSLELYRQQFTQLQSTQTINEISALPKKILDACTEPTFIWQLEEISSKSKAVIQKLMEEGYLKEVISKEKMPQKRQSKISHSDQTKSLLSDAQQMVLDELKENQSKPMLLWGDTGSGKTVIISEFYRQRIKCGRQWLILLPEISLLENIAKRIAELTGKRIEIYHGSLTDARRKKIAKMVMLGETDIIIGTRSAVFLPFNNLGLITVDECHDRSFKDAQSCRYHARDIAITRASLLNIPIILASATPDLDTLNNAEINKYHLVRLKERFGEGQLAKVELVDLSKEAHFQGLSAKLFTEIELVISKNEQALLFINRKGFAPVLLCGDCNWKAQCPNCTARLTWFKGSAALKCHACGYTMRSITHCPDCHGPNLIPIGLATERVESLLIERYPHARILRVDRDIVQNQREIEIAIKKIEDGEVDIIVSTQILAKAVNFEKLSFVAVLDVDQGLLSLDPRASEYTGQQVIQVMGRAGRFKKGAKALIQTAQANRVELEFLLEHDWQGYAKYLLNERYLAQLPPFAASLVIRGESQVEMTIENAFSKVYELLSHQLVESGWQQEISVTPPFAARIERVDRHYRRIIFITARHRKTRNALINKVASRLEKLVPAKTCRWHIDVDPIELG